MRAHLPATPAVEEIWSCLWQKDIKIEFLCDTGDFSILSDLRESDDTGTVAVTFCLSAAIFKHQCESSFLTSVIVDKIVTKSSQLKGHLLAFADIWVYSLSVLPPNNII